MLKLIRSLLPFAAKTETESDVTVLPAELPNDVHLHGAEAFPLQTHLLYVDGLPYLDWQAVTQWLDGIPSAELQAQGWANCEIAWLQHLRAALGDHYVLRQQGEALLLSSLEPSVAEATLAYMSKTLRRIQRILDGIVQVPEWGKDILIVVDDNASYYQYVAHYYPDGEFATSSGMHISAGCSHFVTMKADLHDIEPVIAHEMTHGCLSHLPIPLWLNEGLAVNTEKRVSRSPGSLYTVQEIQQKHLRYWGAREIQEFWSGHSFLRTDDGNLLSYDLAQKIVEHLAADWDRFKRFVLAANAIDGGASAMLEEFNLDLGEVAAAIIGRDLSPDWTPNQSTWPEASAN